MGCFPFLSFRALCARVGLDGEERRGFFLSSRGVKREGQRFGGLFFCEEDVVPRLSESTHSLARPVWPAKAARTNEACDRVREEKGCVCSFQVTEFGGDYAELPRRGRYDEEFLCKSLPLANSLSAKNPAAIYFRSRITEPRLHVSRLPRMYVHNNGQTHGSAGTAFSTCASRTTANNEQMLVYQGYDAAVPAGHSKRTAIYVVSHNKRCATS